MKKVILFVIIFLNVLEILQVLIMNLMILVPQNLFLKIVHHVEKNILKLMIRQEMLRCWIIIPVTQKRI